MVLTTEYFAFSLGINWGRMLLLFIGVAGWRKGRRFGTHQSAMVLALACISGIGLASGNNPTNIPTHTRTQSHTHTHTRTRTQRTYSLKHTHKHTHTHTHTVPPVPPPPTSPSAYLHSESI